MACGFPAYTEETVRFRGSARNALARAALNALDDLGWRPEKDGRDRLVAAVPNEFQGIFMTWGAKFVVEIDDEELFVRSEGTVAIAWMDFGQHAQNIHKFLNRLEDFLENEEE